MTWLYFLLASVNTGCTSEKYSRLYHTEVIAPSLNWDSIESLDHMGPKIIDNGVNFSVYSENATRIDLLLFDDPEADLPTQQYEMNRSGNVWNIYVEGLGIGQHYGYIAWGPNWEYDPEWTPGNIEGFVADVDADGNRFNPNKLLFDPWSKAIHRDHDWFKGSSATGPKRNESTWAAGSKSVIVQSDYEWSDTEEAWQLDRENGELEGHDWNELIMYEVHPKGLTQNNASGVDHPGTYRGIGEMAPYLKDLGINAIELLPIHEKPLDAGYWGYNNLNFFAPEHSQSAEYQQTGLVLDVIDEFKWMVDQLHQNDIEVIIDVVYNHTGEGGLWRERLFYERYGEEGSFNFDPKEVTGLYTFRGLDNASWYALSTDGQSYINNTGVGNQTRPNHTPMRRLIMDSLRFYVEELHVDGFRFDLAGILGEKDLNYSDWIDPSETVLQDIIDDPLMQSKNTRIIAEPWTAMGTGPGIGGFPTSSDGNFAWYEWNAKYRDWWRSFINSDEYVLNSNEGIGYDGYTVMDGGQILTGSSGLYGWNERKPYHSVNFVTVHDGFTLYDLFTYNEKQNGCGLLNPVCCDDPLSVWCDTESGEEHNRSRDWADEPTKRQMMRNMFAGLFFSHGTPMILGGDEWMRTQYGNNNSYYIAADNEWNWFRWGEWKSSASHYRARMHDFVRNLSKMRKDRMYAFSPKEHGEGMPFSWKTRFNSEMSGDDWSGKTLMLHYYSTEEWDKPEILVIINMDRENRSFTLPEGRTWGRLLDTQSYFDRGDILGEPEGYLSENPDLDMSLSANITLENPAVIAGATYDLMGSSIVILEAQ